MKKKLFAGFALVLAVLVLLTGCGGSKGKLVGKWQLVDEASETQYGYGLEFKKDGTLTYGITEEMLALTGGDADAEDWDDMMDSLDALMKIEYKVKSATEMEIKVSAFMGLASEKTTVAYSLEGDTLVFDGATYTRVK